MDLRHDALAGAAEAMVELERLACDSPQRHRRRHGRRARRRAPGRSTWCPARCGWTSTSATATSTRATAWSTASSSASRVHRRAARPGARSVETIIRGHAGRVQPARGGGGRAACAELEIPYREMISGAYHDAMVLGAEIPIGMIFVPSAGGVSHHPDEYTAPEELDRGVAVLARRAGRGSRDDRPAWSAAGSAWHRAGSRRRRRRGRGRPDRRRSGPSWPGRPGRRSTPRGLHVLPGGVDPHVHLNEPGRDRLGGHSRAGPPRSWSAA